MVIVDSSVLIDHLRAVENPQTIWLNQNRSTEPIGITSLARCEVLRGVRGESRFRQTEIDLSQFQTFEIPTATLARASALNYRFLRKLGLTIRTTIDCLIATFCIEEGHILLHNDRDFDAFEIHLSLRVLHPSEPTRH